MRNYMVFILFTVYLNSEIYEHHDHLDTMQLKLNYEYMKFENSKQKENGRRYGIEIDYQSHKHHTQIYTEHSDTQTKPIVPRDLSVNKIALKYQYKIDNNVIILSYISIKDNLINEVDDGQIYGFGYRYKFITLTQYISDYKRFSVYQTDMKLGMKRNFFDINFMGAIIGKYIHLNNRLSNNFSKKAKDEYGTLGVKLHLDYKDLHVGVGTYIGERIFAVMNDGLRVQHHAMEFNSSYMFSIAKEFDNILVDLRYIRQVAKEVPIDNDDVKVSTISLNVEYKF